MERRLRVFEVGESADWRISLVNCARGFCHLRSSRFLMPHEVGSLKCGAVYLIEDKFPATVEEQLPSNGKGFLSEIAWPWIEQLLEGLAELHAVGLPHGSWQLSSLLLDTHSVDSSTKIILGDAVGGRIPWMSKGERLKDNLSAFFPPEWNGRLQSPSPQADVYALGLVACEMLLGRDAVRKVKEQCEQSTASPARLRQQLLNKIQNKGISRRGRRTLNRMLEPNPQLRPAHAAAVIQESNTGLRLVPILAVIATVLLLVAIGLGIGWSWHVGDLTSKNAVLNKLLDEAGEESKRQVQLADKAKADHDKIVGELRARNQDVIDLDKRVAELKKQIVELEEIVKNGKSPTPGPSSLERAKLKWGQLSSNISLVRSSKLPTIVEKAECKPDERAHLKLWAKVADQAWRGVNHSFTAAQRQPNAALTERERAVSDFKREPWRDELRVPIVHAYWRDFLPESSVPPRTRVSRMQEKIEKAPTDTWVRKELDPFVKSLNSEVESWKPWFDRNQPRSLLAPFPKRLETPWNETARTAAATQLRSLQIAGKIWQEYADISKDSWSDFKEKVERKAASEDVRVSIIVKAWISEFDKPAKWQLTLKSGTAPKDYGTYRIVRLIVDGKEIEKSVDQRDWPSETKYDYESSGKNQPATFSWRPGQPIVIALDGVRFISRAGYRPEIFSEPFNGPVALWLMSRRGRASHVNGGSLTFGIPDCPGPP